MTALLVVQLDLEFSHDVGPEAGKLHFEKSKFAVQFGIEAIHEASEVRQLRKAIRGPSTVALERA